MILDKSFEADAIYYRVAVEDNGPGIPLEQKKMLFSRLISGTARTGGKGLGLYLVLSLVEDAGGRIWVEDRIPDDYGKGSRFVILLPAYVSHNMVAAR